MDYRRIITVDPQVCGGKPCIRRLPITVAEILEHLASGVSVEHVLAAHAQLTREDVIACLEFATAHDTGA